MKIKIPMRELRSMSQKPLLATINRLISELREQYSLAHDGESLTKEQLLAVINDSEDFEIWGANDIVGR